ncbi:Hcp1 family type VI secretion system effector [Yersinia thracica]|uniref:Hcp1 family type VI secretion system effector n=1 Tax=Yersinia thracica TaxID=2890319 RepID=A0A0T9NG75_9GAMM|nr:type VI secretion system tube protein Hcp [Yersinia thracica]CNH06344.1 Hcp1 family type VI secretion system effector [Yersinia thracica]
MSQVNSDMFLKIDSVNGESKDKVYAQTTAIVSFSWGAAQPSNMGHGGGGGAGKVVYKDLHINTVIDKSTATILKFCSIGKHINEVVLIACKAGNGGSKFEYFNIKLQNVMITDIHYNAVGFNGEIGMSYTLHASKISQHYWEQAPSGGKGVETSFGWDISEGTEWVVA